MGSHVYATADEVSAAVLMLPEADRRKAIAVPQEDGTFEVLVPDELDAAMSAIDADAAARNRLMAYATAKRYAVETGGILVGGANVDTSRDSQGMIANAHAYVVNSGVPSVRFKAKSGWVVLPASQVTAIALAVGAHVQTCFDLEGTISDKITTGIITTMAEIDEANWPMGASA